MTRLAHQFTHHVTRLLVVITLVAALAPVLTTRAAGNTYFVGSLTDDTGMNTGACILSSNTTCTLRDALAIAISGADTIQFDANASVGTYRLGTGTNQGTLVIAQSVTITGPGSDKVAVDGGYNPGTQSGGTIVFKVNNGVSATISGLEITHGNNQAGGGGGIESLGSLTLTNDLIDYNKTTDVGGGVDGAVGAIVTVTGCSFIGNTAGNYGGAMYIATDGASITTSTFSGNRATYGGGAIFAASHYQSVTNSTITGNTASGYGGGGIYTFDGAITLSDDTITGNTAAAPGGGGIFGIAQGLTLSNSTIAGNNVTGGGTGGGLLTNGAAATFADSIIANNGAGNCASTGTMLGVTDDGHNLQYPGASCGATITVVDPLLDPAGLKNNGGPTQTLALLPASPAIDAVPATGANCALTDQRGITRPQPAGGNCDIGAYEYVPVQPSVSGAYRAGTGGQPLRITGSGFQRGSQVVVDRMTLPANAVTQLANDGTSLEVSLPAHAAGVVTLAVRNPGNLTSAATGNLTYTVPNGQVMPHTAAPTVATKPLPQETRRATPPLMGMGGSPTPTPIPQPMRH